LPLEVEPIGKGPATAASLLGMLRRPGAALIAGSHGAVAEIPAGPSEDAVLEDGRYLRLRRPGGAMSVDLAHPDLRLLEVRIQGLPTTEPSMVVLASPPTWPTGAVRRLGPDLDALEPEHRGSLIHDLGVGHGGARFCVRSATPALASLLDQVEGHPGLDVVTALGPQIAALAPTRVVLLPFGRVEITAPIPPPDLASPDGPHTHLRPEQVALGLTGPPELTLPDGLLPAAILHLPSSPT